MAPRIVTEGSDDGLIDTRSAIGRPTYLHWEIRIFAGAIVAAAVSFILISFGAGIGLAVASPSSTWRDTSSPLALLWGLWLEPDGACRVWARRIFLAGSLREAWSTGS